MIHELFKFMPEDIKVEALISRENTLWLTTHKKNERDETN